jgi:hypothetical protein
MLFTYLSSEYLISLKIGTDRQGKFIVTEHYGNVRMSSPCKGTVRITIKVTTEVVCGYTNTLQFETMLIDQIIKESLRFLANEHNVINIVKNIFILSDAVMHPHIWICLGR